MKVQKLELKTVVSFLLLAFVALAFMPSTAEAYWNRWSKDTKKEIEINVNADTAPGENQKGWLFNRDVRTSTAHDFNDDESSIGGGSVYAGPITNTNFSGFPGNNPNWDKFIAEYFPEIEISELNSFSYDFLIGSGGDASDENEFYLNVYTNFGESDDNNFYDCRYNIVPTTGSTADWTTVTFDPTESYPVTTRGSSPYTCPGVPAEMDDLSPGSNIRAFALNMGDTSANDTGLDGYFDNVVVDTEHKVTTFDFEPFDPNCEAGYVGHYIHGEFYACYPTDYGEFGNGSRSRGYDWHATQGYGWWGDNSGSRWNRY